MLFKFSLLFSSALTFLFGFTQARSDALPESLNIPLGSIEKAYAEGGGAGDCSGCSGVDQYAVPAQAGLDIEFREPGTGVTGWGVYSGGGDSGGDGGGGDAAGDSAGDAGDGGDAY